MGYEDLCTALGDQLDSGSYHDNTYGEYHPSGLSGCPLGVFLDFMTEDETEYNHYMFSGTAVHYYLQESGKLTQALHNAGFNAMYTEYEVQNKHHIGDGAHVIGRVDALADSPEKRVVIDIKYTSLKPQYDNGRLLKYASQVNTYANMFDADEWVLLMIYSKADSVPDEIDYISGETDQENWEITKDKARNIHEALTAAGFHDGVRWSVDELKERGPGFWEEIMEHFDEDRVPAYDGELKYSDRDEWVLPYQDNWREDEKSGGLMSFKS